MAVDFVSSESVRESFGILKQPACLCCGANLIGVVMVMIKGSVSSPTVQTEALGPDYTISRIINGGWQLAGGHGPVDRDRTIKVFE